MFSGLGLTTSFLEGVLGALGCPVLSPTDKASALWRFTALLTAPFLATPFAFSFAIFPFALGLSTFALATLSWP